MTGEAIKQCNSLDLLELEQEKVYRDCCDINDCSQCCHFNEDDLCDLELITRQKAKLTR